MTYNEFKMCCILFCKKFEGKKYGEVVEGCYSNDADCIISITGITFRTCRFGCFKNNYLFSYTIMRQINIQLEVESNIWFTDVKDFLNHFKISSKDIV